ncbi:MAG TPA: NADH-quinone oxidoreductase subunit NuoH [Caulobacteraceae bacterium]|nr:NADH-quinone oxidoreductase subunit NuoH [Caulobacteraceae bacterium]
MTWFALAVGQIALILVWLLLSLAFLLWADRKVWAGVQLRKGPNVVGPFGLLQGFADLIKFVLKEQIVPAGADKTVFLLAPLISFTLAFGAWAVMPLAPGWVASSINVGILYLFAVSSLGVYGVIMGGWASNSKYPFLGGLRSAAQMVSYEVSIGFIIVTVIVLAGSMNLVTIVENQAGGFWHWNVLGGHGVRGLPAALVMIPMAVLFFVSAMAETNRPPFDLPEAESEIVAGYHVEYSATGFLLFQIGEYASIVLMCAMTTVLFFGGWNLPWPQSFSGWDPTAASFVGFLVFFAKTLFFFFIFAMTKAVVPRYRYDQLMRLGWKVFLPTSLAAVVLIGAWRVFGLPA